MDSAGAQEAQEASGAQEAQEAQEASGTGGQVAVKGAKRRRNGTAKKSGREKTGGRSNEFEVGLYLGKLRNSLRSLRDSKS